MGGWSDSSAAPANPFTIVAIHFVIIHWGGKGVSNMSKSSSSKKARTRKADRDVEAFNRIVETFTDQLNSLTDAERERLLPKFVSLIEADRTLPVPNGAKKIPGLPLPGSLDRLAVEQIRHAVYLLGSKSDDILANVIKYLQRRLEDNGPDDPSEPTPEEWRERIAEAVKLIKGLSHSAIKGIIGELSDRMRQIEATDSELQTIPPDDWSDAVAATQWVADCVDRHIEIGSSRPGRGDVDLSVQFMRDGASRGVAMLQATEHLDPAETVDFCRLIGQAVEAWRKSRAHAEAADQGIVAPSTLLPSVVWLPKGEKPDPAPRTAPARREPMNGRKFYSLCLATAKHDEGLLPGQIIAERFILAGPTQLESIKRSLTKVIENAGAEDVSKELADLVDDEIAA